MAGLFFIRKIRYFYQLHSTNSSANINYSSHLGQPKKIGAGALGVSAAAPVRPAGKGSKAAGRKLNAILYVSGCIFGQCLKIMMLLEYCRLQTHILIRHISDKSFF